jgi:hypothetical protein
MMPPVALEGLELLGTAVTAPFVDEANLTRRRKVRKIDQAIIKTCIF